jgi:predicted alpha-1,2-mannosidase
MKYLLPLLFIATIARAQTDFTKYVDPFIGTGGHGHTYPGATMPHGMVQLSPDTRIDGSWDGCGGYHYSDSIIYGFSHTHLSGTGVSDYGDIMLMPMVGSPSFDNKIYSSKFSHSDEKASAGYYSVKVDDKNILVELTSTARVGMHRYTPSGGKALSVILDLTHRDKLLKGTIRKVNETTFEGLRKSEAWARDQWVFYRIEFSKPVAKFNVEKSNENDAKASFTFSADKTNTPLLVKVALSAVDEEGAKNNMQAEMPDWNFEKVKKDAHDAWQKELSTIEVRGGTDEQFKIFYTALYHCMIVPNIYNDVNGLYRGRDNKIHKADGFDYYTVFSLWDTFRAWHPLMTIIDRKRTLDYIKTFLAQYEEGGLLPVWELSSNETECMIGYHSVSAIADAAIKGITDFNMDRALEAMKKSAEAKNRFGLGAYMDHGYLSMEDENESVSKTLEYAYDDWCIAQMAKLMNNQKEYDYYTERSQYWKNLFDPVTGFIRPKKNGEWLTPFEPREVNNNYTEANAWQYTFFVPHDVAGLVQMCGGQNHFARKLDELFAADSKTTGRDQSDITGLIGQYAHGNEPSHHMAYLYNYIGKPSKADARVHQVLDNFYHAAPDGLIGNEDCGQMSAWYVMAAMGLYQVCPGNTKYALSTPLFSEIIIHQENGKNIVIQNNGLDKNRTASANLYKWIPAGKHIPMYPGNEPFIFHENLVEGGALIFEATEDIPAFTKKEKKYSSSVNTDFVTVPIIKATGKSFKKSMPVSIVSLDGVSKVFYTLDGSSPTALSSAFTSELQIDSSCTIKAIAVNDSGKASKITTARFYKMPHAEWTITLHSKYNPQYTAGGDEGLIDGIRGDVNWRKGDWQGFQSQDFEAVIDMGKEQQVSKFSAGFLQDVRAWIFMPKSVDFELSVDGKNYVNPLSISNTIPDKDEKVQIRDLSGTITPQNARYVRIKATNYGKLPSWHAGYPDKGDAFIFIDEISIE